MTIWHKFIPEASLSSLETLVETASSKARKGDGVMLLACDANNFTPEFVDPILSQAKFPIFGGVFPSVIYGKKTHDYGTIAVTLPITSGPFFIPNFDDKTTRFDKCIEDVVGNEQIGKTMAVFVDGFSNRIESFVEGLFNVFGLDLHYIGGGAGSLSMESKPCIFTNAGMKSNGAIIVPLRCDSGVGVCHGWKVLSGPYQVTESHYNVVNTINWRPAFEVYAEAIAPHCVGVLDQNNLFQVSKAFPFGITRLDAEQLVRDPISVDEHGALLCAGEVPEGAFVHLLYGNDQSLIDAAGEALERARIARPAWKASDLHLLIDCISRVLFLGDRFHEELDAVCRENLPLIGACTIGEIANNGTSHLEFFNKTAVVAVLENT